MGSVTSPKHTFHDSCCHCHLLVPARLFSATGGCVWSTEPSPRTRRDPSVMLHPWKQKRLKKKVSPSCLSGHCDISLLALLGSYRPSSLDFCWKCPIFWASQVIPRFEKGSSIPQKSLSAQNPHGKSKQHSPVASAHRFLRTSDSCHHTPSTPFCSICSQKLPPPKQEPPLPPSR